jgi:hypothetical protein
MLDPDPANEDKLQQRITEARAADLPHLHSFHPRPRPRHQGRHRRAHAPAPQRANRGRQLQDQDAQTADVRTRRLRPPPPPHPPRMRLQTVTTGSAPEPLFLWLKGWHRTRWPLICETPASCPGQADRTGSAGGCLNTTRTQPTGRYQDNPHTASGRITGQTGSQPRPYARNHPKPRKQGRKLYSHPPCRFSTPWSLSRLSTCCAQIILSWTDRVSPATLTPASDNAGPPGPGLAGPLSAG